MTFNGEQAFVQGSGSQPPLFLDVFEIFHDCTRIAWRWVTTSGAGDDAEPVRGIDVFHTLPSTGQVSAVYAEFNSLSFAIDLGKCTNTTSSRRLLRRF